MRYIRNKSLYTKKIKDKWYILEPSHKVMRELNEVAGTIWVLLAKPASIETLTKEICRKFKVDYDLAENDIRTFVNEYLRDGFIEKVS